MIAPSIPDNEVQRLASLERYAVLDTPSEAAFERMVNLVARIFEVPIAMVTFIERDRQWFKACIGIELRENTRALSLCSHTILTNEVMVVPDTIKDQRFADNPVLQQLGVRFYGGASLRTSDGHNIGTLCIYDFKPRADFTPAQPETITDLAAMVMDDLDARSTATRAVQAEKSLARVNVELAARLEQLGQLNAAQKRFVADASHELRTPLMLIQGNIDLILKYPDLDLIERETALLEAKAETERLSRLVSDMLHLARNDSFQTEVYTTLDFAQVVSSSLEESRSLANNHSLTLNITASGQVLGHADRLKQLVVLLIDNACKYTPTPGRVEVSTSNQADQLELRVQDTGVGISEPDLERVFERFYRSESARGNDLDGTGLGLPIARAIVEAHGGRIWIESEIGKGSCVIVRLPRAPVVLEVTGS
jgi:two-component system, sensor histidine kinase